jgi:hypothetical protein
VLDGLVHLWRASAITPKEWTGIITFWCLGFGWAVVSGLWRRYYGGVRLRRDVHYVDVTPTQKLRARQVLDAATTRADSGRR